MQVVRFFLATDISNPEPVEVVFVDPKEEAARRARSGKIKEPRGYEFVAFVQQEAAPTALDDQGVEFYPGGMRYQYNAYVTPKGRTHGLDLPREVHTSPETAEKAVSADIRRFSRTRR